MSAGSSPDCARAKLVLDTNVLLSGILVPGACRELLKGRAQAHERSTSSRLLVQLADKLSGKLKRVPERTTLFLVYRQRARIVIFAPLAAPLCRDADALVLATAPAAGADAIITGDKDLLILDNCEGIRIRTPRRFSDSPAA